MDRNKLFKIVWVFPDSLTENFNTAPRLEITKEMRQAGWQVTLISPGPAGTHSIQGVDIFCLPRPDIYFLRQVVFHIRVCIYLRKNWNDVDVVFFSQMSSLWLLPLWILRKMLKHKRPLFVMDTRTVPMELWEKANLKDFSRGIFHSLMTRLSNYWVDGQTTITKRMAESIGITDKRLWGTWPSGVNLDKFSPAIQHRTWPADNEAIALIYVGVLHFERNLLSLCKAVAKANASGMNFTFTQIGDGTERRFLEAFTQKTQGQIQVLPPVPHDQIPLHLAKAHVGVLPFPMEEKFRVSSPIKLFEYMAAGLPILATEIECHTDVVMGREFAFWAKNASEEGLLEALNQVWENRSNLKNMGQEASLAANSWTWRESAQKLQTSLLHGILQSRGNDLEIGKE